jgi:hypothetical protein
MKFLTRKKLPHIPTDLQILDAIYERYYQTYADFVKSKSDRSTKIYVPIDVGAIARVLDVDGDIVFGRLYYHLEDKHGYTRGDGSRVQRRKLARMAEKFERGPVYERNISQYHRGQREALYAAKERRIAHRQTTLREHNRATWAFLHRQQRAERKELDETRKSRWKGMLYFLRYRQELKSPGGLKWFFEGLTGYHGVDFWEAMNKRHEADRKRLAERVGREKREALAEINSIYRDELNALKEAQKAERQTLKGEYAAQAQDPARPRRERKPRSERQQAGEQELSEEFQQRVRQRVRRRRRDERKRDRDGGRERDD